MSAAEYYELRVRAAIDACIARPRLQTRWDPRRHCWWRTYPLTQSICLGRGLWEID